VTTAALAIVLFLPEDPAATALPGAALVPATVGSAVPAAPVNTPLASRLSGGGDGLVSSDEAGPALAAASAQSEFGSVLDLPERPPATQVLGEGIPRVGLSPGVGSSGGVGPDLTFPVVSPPDKATRVASQPYEGDDSVTLFEAVADGKPRPSGAAAPVSTPPPAKESAPAPTGSAPRGAAAWVAAVLASVPLWPQRRPRSAVAPRPDLLSLRKAVV
jgi:hypothetical protein